VDEFEREILTAIGDGGTTDMASRVAVFVREQVIDDKVPELGGLAEVAEILGESRQTVGHLISGRRGAGDFPEPIARLAATSVWIMSDIVAWKRLQSG